MNFIKKLVNWYFRRNSLPYWCIFILDGFILLFSGLVGFWMFSGWENLIQHIDGVFYSLMIYVLFSCVLFIALFYLPLMSVTYHLRLRDLYKNAIMLVFGTILRNIAALAYAAYGHGKKA